MRTTSLFLISFVALILALGCNSEKQAKTQEAGTAEETQAQLHEVKLAVSGMT